MECGDSSPLLGRAATSRRTPHTAKSRHFGMDAEMTSLLHLHIPTSGDRGNDKLKSM